MDYAGFLQTKQRMVAAVGADPTDLNASLFDFQKDIVRWACRIGRAAIFADCGMGKTLMQLEWARHQPGRTLILAPLAVAKQTEREGAKFGIEAVYSRAECGARIVVTNYEMLEHFEPAAFDAVVIDESSILKNYDGAFRNRIIASFAKTPYRLACTATPAPNDFMELGNHSEFLGIMKRSEMLATFFVHEGQDTRGWRLKGHAEGAFWDWVCSWAVVIRKPSDLEYDDGGFKLPPMEVSQHAVEAERSTVHLFPMEVKGLRERIAARRDSIDQRCAEASKLALGAPAEPWIIWCALNREAEAVANAIPGAVNLTGSDSLDVKETVLERFVSGEILVLVTKPSIAGFGLNLQHCSNVIFLGLSDSWESYYQCVRRCWRFGQKRQVNVHIVISETEGPVLANILRKEADADTLFSEIVLRTKVKSTAAIHDGRTNGGHVYTPKTETGDAWVAVNGDCVEECRKMADGSIDYSVFSPPFADLYTYTDSERDMGNCRSQGQFLEHFEFLAAELHRVLVPGRLVSVHCMNLPSSKTRDGVIGIRDFRGDIIRLFESRDFIFHSEVVIWKDPVTAMQRTKALGLLHKQLVKDSTMSRMGIPDYVVTFRKPGDNPKPVTGELKRFVGDPATFTPEGRFSIDVWQRYASPIWSDIRQGRTLQRESAREDKDEKHIAPLQLDVIERCLDLWTNPGDLVLSPFMGIGSEGYCAVRTGRRFLGVELKASYWGQGVLNLRRAETEAAAPTLFSKKGLTAVDANA